MRFKLYLLFIASLLIFQACDSDSVKYPEFVKLQNVKFGNVKLPPNMAVTFSSDMVLNNPNPVGVTISKMEFDVFIDGKKSTHIVQDTNVKMPANSDFTMPLSFQIPINHKEIFKNLKDVLSGAWKKQAMDIRSVGKIYVKVMGKDVGIPFDHEDTYRLVDYL